jgi:hypothetical protein
MANTTLQLRPQADKDYPKKTTSIFSAGFLMMRPAFDCLLPGLAALAVRIFLP